MKFVTIILAVVFLTGCRNSSDDGESSILARVNDEYLYESEIRDLIPDNISPRDSIVLVKNYINSWITKQVLINQAEKNLSREQMDFNRQLQEYRNSLLIYQYEKELLYQKLDTVVKDYEIFSYYNDFKENFILKEDIYTINFLQMPEGSEAAEVIEDLFTSGNPELKDSIITLMVNVAGMYDFSDKNWLSLNSLKSIFPGIFLTRDDQEISNSNFRDTNGQVITLISIGEMKNEGQVAPLSYVSDNIREIIINKRRADFIKNMHNEIVRKAYQNEEAEIY
ncbi:MAG: hypothetical protein KKA81_07670 [Bacteroidetes bacterium]|nr:hypothetical protein [Bacteroidota bacterium]